MSFTKSADNTHPRDRPDDRYAGPVHAGERQTAERETEMVPPNAAKATG
jgi:hypothetical protein